MYSTIGCTGWQVVDDFFMATRNSDQRREILARAYRDIAAVVAATAPCKAVAAGATGTPDQPVAKITRTEKRFSADARLLLDWLKRRETAIEPALV